MVAWSQPLSVPSKAATSQDSAAGADEYSARRTLCPIEMRLLGASGWRFAISPFSSTCFTALLDASLAASSLAA